MKLKSVVAGLAVSCGLFAGAANATLFTTDFGSLVPGYVTNDDNTFSATLPFSLNYFGTTTSNIVISNNGNVQFGTNSGSFSPSPLNTDTQIKAIAPFWTDLDSRSDPLGAIAAGTGGSGVYINQISPTEVVITWDRLGYFSGNYSGRAQFQLVLQDPTSAIPVGQGAIGFFYGAMSSGTDGHNVTVGFGDGLAAVNTGEISVFSNSSSAATAPGALQDQWFNLDGGIVTTGPGTVPEPASMALLGLGLAGLGFSRRRKQ